MSWLPIKTQLQEKFSECGSATMAKHRLTQLKLGCMFYKRTTRRTHTYSEGPIIMQVSRMGFKIKPKNNNNNKDTNSKIINRRGYITVPYMKGLSESIKNTCKRYGIQVYFKGGKTIKDLLVAPKDKEHITKKSGIIYRCKCDRLECDEEYIVESARTFGERFREHLKVPFPIYDHRNITGHTTTLENFSIVGREDKNLTRLIKESM